MPQLSLLDVPATLRKRHHGVQRTSVLAYQAVDAKNRIKHAVDLLTIWAEVMPEEDHQPTSAELYELAKYREESWAPKTNEALGLMHLRSGLSDAKRHGLVENGEPRKCGISGRMSLTWRVRGR